MFDYTDTFNFHNSVRQVLETYNTVISVGEYQ